VLKYNLGQNLLEKTMELNRLIIKEAETILRFEGDNNLPKQLLGMPFFVARGDDESILAHDAIKFGGQEYKIGTKKQ
jgi:hypothetical protein